MKIFWIAAGSIAVLLLGTTLLLAASGIETGWTTVKVHEKQDGIRLYIPLPGPVVDGGLRLAGAFGPCSWQDHCPTELGEWAPAVKALAEALADAPDAVLVEVTDGDEQVLVAKRRGKLVVEVTAPDADVRVSVPAALLPRALAVAGI